MPRIVYAFSIQFSKFKIKDIFNIKNTQSTKILKYQFPIIIATIVVL